MRALALVVAGVVYVALSALYVSASQGVGPFYDGQEPLNVTDGSALNTIGGSGGTPTFVGNGEVYLDGNTEVNGSLYVEGGIISTSGSALGFEAGDGQAFRAQCDGSVCMLDLTDGGTQPTCDATHRGNLWFDQSGAGVKDTVDVCAKDAGDAYAWRSIY